ncbi:MAG TPA: hypothetical protein VFA04_00125 [Bryobacteraceae bacterium]|nr:hypothetical protein [Bryobacteraceae bacterium]
MGACIASGELVDRSVSARPRRPRAVLYTFCITVVIFAIQHVAVLAGMVRTPRGFAPALMLREQDICQYFTWIALGQKHWLLPDYHAPWITTPALLQPLFLVEARTVSLLGANPLAVYYFFSFLLLWLAVWSFAFTLRTFCPTKAQRAAAVALLVCCLPIPLFIPRFTTFGIFQYAYLTADGLTRGGIMTSPTLSLGTAIALLGMSSLARFLRGRERRDLLTFQAIVLVGAFFHPFEPILLATVGAAAFLLHRDGESIGAAAMKGAAALGLVFAGMAPHLWLSYRTPWLRAVAQTGHSTSTQSILWTPQVFGVPAMAVIYFLLLRWRRPLRSDAVLQFWFIAAPLLALVPQMPLAVHLFDGYACCTTMLLVRYAVDDKLLTWLHARRPNLMRAGFATWVAASACIVAAILVRIGVEARAPEPSPFPRTIISYDERRVLAWIQSHAAENDLAMAPLETAYSIAALPMHAFASHYNFSIDFGVQREEQERFTSNRMSGAEQTQFLTKYGIRYLILSPAQSRPDSVRSAIERADFGGWRIFEFPGNRMVDYVLARWSQSALPSPALKAATSVAAARP